jgi:NADP-dependent 3-hydroxy acid dehydrogenase YdfG
MRRVLISGGGSGIGLACARAFRAAGDEVWLLGRTQDRLEAAQSELGGAGVEIRVCDVASAAAVDGLGGELRERRLPVDVLVNNAGLFLAGSLLKAREEQAAAMWEVHVMGPWRLLRICADPALRQGRPLRVVNVLSVTAQQPYSGCGFYGATKAALGSLMAVARAELRGQGVRISNLYPGATETPIWSGRDMDFTKMMDPQSVAEAVRACADMPERALVEEMVLRPAGGDL